MSRIASLLLTFGGVWVDDNMCFVVRVHRVVACVVEGSFGASRLGLRRGL